MFYANDAQAGEVPQKPARQDEGNATRGNTVAFGEFGLQSLKASWITARQIEAGRVACSHFLRREGRVFIRIFPAQARLGQAAGNPHGQGQGRAGILGAPW